MTRRRSAARSPTTPSSLSPCPTTPAASRPAPGLPGGGTAARATTALALVALAFGALVPAAAVASGSHRHGVALLNLALEDDRTVAVELVAPAQDVVGFEHGHPTEAEQRAAAEALAALRRNLGTILVFDSDLGCRAGSEAVAMEGFAGAEADHGHAAAEEATHDHGEDHGHGREAQHDDGHDHGGHDHGGHNHGAEHREVIAGVTFTCRRPLGGARIQSGVRTLLPKVHEVEVQILSLDGQRSLRLQGTERTIDL